jgi:hypothetical protein
MTTAQNDAPAGAGQQAPEILDDARTRTERGMVGSRNL